MVYLRLNSFMLSFSEMEAIDFPPVSISAWNVKIESAVDEEML